MVISGTDGHIWYIYSYPVRYDHLYLIWLSVPDMTICTRYNYLPHSVTIDHLYRIWLSVKDMINSGTDSHIWYRQSYLVQIVISGTDSHIWYIVISGTDCQIVISRTDGHTYVPDMTICTRYNHLYGIWPSLLEMTICTGYDYLYQISPSVLDMTIWTAYDHLYQIWLSYLYWIWQMVISGTYGHIRYR
jgi:hypothetical protein